MGIYGDTIQWESTEIQYSGNLRRYNTVGIYGDTIQPECGERDGTADFVSRHRILRRERPGTRDFFHLFS